jgi:gliding motility-associated-like protein
MKSTSKKHLSYIILSFFLTIGLTNSVKAQFWTEDFVTPNAIVGGSANGYIGANPGAWTITLLAGNTGGANANTWYVSCEEASMQINNCGDVCPPIPLPPPTPFIAQSLHLGLGAVDLGAAYLETGFNQTDSENRVESPTINCSGQSIINLSFNYIEFGDFLSDNAQVWYFDGITWSFLADMPKTSCGDALGGPCNVVPCGLGQQGIWSNFSVALPASADNNPNVKIGFYWQNIDDGIATDPSVAIGKIELTSVTASNTITAGNLVGPFCAGATATLPFGSTGTFNSGNVYTVELSDATGSFAVPVSIGSLTSTALAGLINLTFPANAITGAGYLIRIVSSAPSDTSLAIGPFTINANVPLSASVSANPGSTICPGQCVTFNVAVTNGGAAPTFQWLVNFANAPAPSTLDSLVICTLQPGDLVTVTVTSSLTCVTNSPSNASGLVIQGQPVVPFSVSLTTNPNPFTICSGDTARLFAATVNGGPSPTFAWTVNDVLLPGINNDTLVYSGIPVPIVNNTVICVIGASSIPGCVTNSPDTICDTVSVIQSATPSVTIAADSTTICVGGNVDFTSTVVNGGTNPTYQWFIGPNPVPGAQGTGSTFTTNTLVPGDVVSLTILSNANCTTTPTASSNTIPITVLPYETPTIAIAPNAAICPGQPITFISSHTGGGNNPIYQWLLNDTIPLGTGSNLTVNSSIFANDDTLTCYMISNYLCLLSDTAFSNEFNVQLLAPAELDLGPDVSIFYGESYKTDPEINGPISLGDYLWTPDTTLSCNVCLTPIATPTITTPFALVYKNSNGCVARDTIIIEVKPNYEVFIPSGFSPNGDNLNDVFYARGPFIRKVNMKIWDRFGGMIFESPYANYGWDGTNNFKDVNTGVYVYYITVEFLDGVIEEFKGNITLSR